MTNDQKEVLGLAKKYGVADYPFNILAFAAALEEKHRAKIAMLREACMPFSNLVRTTDGRIPTERLSFADWHNLTKAVSATQQDTAAFIAEVGANALEEAANDMDEYYGTDIPDEYVGFLRRKAEELRASAAQPEVSGQQ